MSWGEWGGDSQPASPLTWAGLQCPGNPQLPSPGPSQLLCKGLKAASALKWAGGRGGGINLIGEKFVAGRCRAALTALRSPRITKPCRETCFSACSLASAPPLPLNVIPAQRDPGRHHPGILQLRAPALPGDLSEPGLQIPSPPAARPLALSHTHPGPELPLVHSGENTSFLSP